MGLMETIQKMMNIQPDSNNGKVSEYSGKLFYGVLFELLLIMNKKYKVFSGRTLEVSANIVLN